MVNYGDFSVDAFSFFPQLNSSEDLIDHVQNKGIRVILTNTKTKERKFYTIKVLGGKIKGKKISAQSGSTPKDIKEQYEQLSKIAVNLFAATYSQLKDSFTPPKERQTPSIHSLELQLKAADKLSLDLSKLKVHEKDDQKRVSSLNEAVRKLQESNIDQENAFKEAKKRLESIKTTLTKQEKNATQRNIEPRIQKLVPIASYVSDFYKALYHPHKQQERDFYRCDENGNLIH